MRPLDFVPACARARLLLTVLVIKLSWTIMSTMTGARMSHRQPPSTSDTTPQIPQQVSHRFADLRIGAAMFHFLSGIPTKIPPFDAPQHDASNEHNHARNRAELRPRHRDLRRTSAPRKKKSR